MNTELQQKIEKAVDKQFDLSKSHTAELLHEILDLCLEMRSDLHLTETITGFHKELLINHAEYLKYYHFTLAGDNPELEQCKQDLLNYKYNNNGK